MKVLQQTRVSTVISYWTSWLSRWPTIHSLARASREDVLSAWKGLGYYSRATRIHEAAQRVVSHPVLRGLLPDTAAELQREVPGVGRYTAGAISSIVFGRAEAILDGNVARVLARQMGVHASAKEKRVADRLWDEAQRIVEAVAKAQAGAPPEPEPEHDSGADAPPTRTETPSLWNQALMELGSTVCTPTAPACGACPIRRTCRAYAEGEEVAIRRGEVRREEGVGWGVSGRERGPEEDVGVQDVEDLCGVCEPMGVGEGEGEGEEEHESTGKKQSATTTAKVNGNGKTSGKAATKPKAQGKAQSSLLAHFTRSSPRSSSRSGPSTTPKTEEQEQKPPAPPNATTSTTTVQLPPKALSTIQAHVRHFPLKAAKAKVREEECVVCVIERRSPAPGRAEAPRWLIEQRPDKGLLASLWEFPTLMLGASEGSGSGGAKEKDKDKAVNGKTKAKATATKAPARGKKRRRAASTDSEEEEESSLSEPSPSPSTDTADLTDPAKTRARLALRFVRSLPEVARVLEDEMDEEKGEGEGATLEHCGEVAAITHVFSHLKLGMYVHRFVLSEQSSGSGGEAREGDESEGEGGGPHANANGKGGKNSGKKAPLPPPAPRRKWATAPEVEAESLSTGMVRCWEAVGTAAQPKGKGTGKAAGGKGPQKKKPKGR